MIFLGRQIAFQIIPLHQMCKAASTKGAMFFGTQDMAARIMVRKIYPTTHTCTPKSLKLRHKLETAGKMEMT
jgi:hypothetical protein